MPEVVPTLIATLGEADWGAPSSSVLALGQIDWRHPSQYALPIVAPTPMPTSPPLSWI